MKASIGALLRSLIPLALVSIPAGLHAQANFVFTDDDVLGPNTVSAFSVAPNGVLTAIPGSPFPTGGTGIGGGLFAANRLAVSNVGNLLYVSNSGSNDVSAFSINPNTGGLAVISGSPFPTGGFATFRGISLAATPNNQFLMAANGGSNNITVFSIGANGALSPIPGSPFAVGGLPDGIKVSPNGQLLAVALPLNAAVAIFQIGPTGAITAVPGSPFPQGGNGRVAGVDINCGSNPLFAGEATLATTIVDVFNIAANGSLTPIPGSPFTPGVGLNSNVALLSPNDQILFVSNQSSNSVTVFTVAPNGALTVVPGAPFPVGGGAFLTAGMATDQAGTFLYTANSPNLVGVFSIASNGALTPVAGSPFSTGQPRGLLSLAAFPAKNCSIQAIQGIIGSVGNLVITGVLNGGQGNALTVKLQAAIDDLNAGNIIDAIRELRAFINQVNSFVADGVLSPAQGQPLIDAAQAVINSLQ